MPASDQLERVLFILPAAARAGGIGLSELAGALEVDTQTVLKDLELVTARAYYHPAGTVEPFTILIESDRVQVHAPNEFTRPIRLNTREALALELGLRTLASESEESRRTEILDLAERLKRELTGPELVMQPRLARDDSALTDARATAEPLTMDVDFGQDDYRTMLADAIDDRRVCSIEYLKAGELNTASRRIAPITLVYASGRWYVAAYDLERGAPRLFRIDRVLGVTMLPDRIEAEHAAIVLDHIADAEKAYAADEAEEVDVTVRYSPRIARWIREYGAAELQDDGAVRVRHQVADAQWLVRHVLQYGGEAVVETQPYRNLIAQAAGELCA